MQTVQDANGAGYKQRRMRRAEGAVQVECKLCRMMRMCMTEKRLRDPVNDNREGREKKNTSDRRKIVSCFCFVVLSHIAGLWFTFIHLSHLLSQPRHIAFVFDSRPQKRKAEAAKVELSSGEWTSRVVLGGGTGI